MDAQGLSVAYEALFEELLAGVSTIPTQQDRPLTGFWPIRGQKFHRGLMIVGRAVNGWIDNYKGFLPMDASRPQERREIAKFFRTDSEPPGGCRMRWVSEFAGEKKGRYNSNRSAFWRVTRRILEGLEPDLTSDPSFGKEWSSHLCWSNISKIAPHEGGNPSTKLWNVQSPFLASLLRLEVLEFNPRRILIMAGREWFGQISQEMGLKLRMTDGLVEGAAIHEGRSWVLAKHPMGKHEGKFVEEVLKAFAENYSRQQAEK